MIKKLAGAALVAAAVTTLMVAPASAASTSSAAAATASESTASRQLIRTKLYRGYCRDTCRIKVRIKNISGYRLFNVKLNARLSVNGRKAGVCYDYVGIIRPYGVRYATCTVRTARLADMWNDFNDFGGRFNPYANTYVSYRYYR